MKYFIFLLMISFNLHALAQKQLVVDPDAVIRELEGSFTSIKVESGIHIFLSQTEKEVLAVSASEEKYREGIKTEIENGTLHIFYKGDKIRYGKHTKLNVYVGFKKIEQIVSSGASNVIFAGVTTLPLLNVQLSGASRLVAAIKIDELNLKLSGASNASLSGNVQKLNIESSGASDVKAYELSTTTCNINASGASDVNIFVAKEISANATGASNIFYKGDAELTSKRSSGASIIAKVQ